MDKREAPTAPICDIGELALALVFRSLGYALLGVIAATVAVVIASAVGVGGISNQNFWPVACLVWALLQVDLFRWLRRIARQSPAVVSTNRTIHRLELSTAGFSFPLLARRPYLIESDASAYPYLQRLFQLLIGLTAFYHLLVLAIFRTKPSRWDAIVPLAAVSAALAPLLR